MKDWIRALNERFTAFNEGIALWAVNHIGTMLCVYAFTFWSLLPLYDKTLEPIVFYVSGGIFQLILLPLIMVGQGVQARAVQKMATEQYNAVMEMLTDIREAHDELQVILKDVTELLDTKDTSNGRR